MLWSSLILTSSVSARSDTLVTAVARGHPLGPLRPRSGKHSAILARGAGAARDLDRAAKLLHRAADRVAPLRRTPEWLLLDVPDPVITLNDIASAVEAAGDFLSAVARSPARWARFYLLRAVAERGIRARASDWCLAFIALGLDKPAEGSIAFGGRVSNFSKDAKFAGLLLLPVR